MENFNVSILVKARPSKRRMANIQKSPHKSKQFVGGQFLIVTRGQHLIVFMGPFSQNSPHG